jgi:hypothetical protein
MRRFLAWSECVTGLKIVGARDGVMALFAVRHPHDATRCPAADVEAGLLVHVR